MTVAEEWVEVSPRVAPALLEYLDHEWKTSAEAVTAEKTEEEVADLLSITDVGLAKRRLDEMLYERSRRRVLMTTLL